MIAPKINEMKRLTMHQYIVLYDTTIPIKAAIKVAFKSKTYRQDYSYNATMMLIYIEIANGRAIANTDDLH